MTTQSLARTALRLLARLALPLSLCASMGAIAANVDLADKPLFSTTSVPGNLLLDLSVEYPTANSAGYFSTANYVAATLYLGYFDGAKCYRYVYKSTAPTTSYFQPISAATATHGCPGTDTLWSGNYLNYASMQGLDIFRWVLTGGNRSVDQTAAQGGMTILTRATHSGQGGAGDAPNKILSSTDEATATPLNFGGGLKTRVWGANTQLWFTSSANLDGSTISSCSATSPTNPCSTDYQDSNLSSLDGSKVYGLYMNVRVCDTSVSVESNCVLYEPGTYKPEGLMQQYSQTLRYGAFGYLNDSSQTRDGGVLRARMAYVGPQVPVPGGPSTPNGNSEWSSTTGVMTANPDPTDVSDSNTFTGVTIAQSGVMNYLNKFGYTSNSYKTYDPVSELYYASIRYLKGLSNVSAYTTMGTANAAAKTTFVDGFPVITDWTSKPAYDPILYSCQKNFVLGIGDVNTHRDGNLPGTSKTTAEPAMPTEVSTDTTINVTTATNTVGTMEGTNSTLGTVYTQAGDYSTYYIAGLAYDAHVPIDGHGIRKYTDPTSNLVTISTASTYWLDVQEYQAYIKNNIYYYATKYGGFTVPSGYAYGTAPTLDAWYNSTNTQPSSPAQKQPDNYFTASNATAMQAGLKSAFAKIVSENNAANGTSLALPTPNVTTTGSVSYSATYDPSSWTGQVIGSSLTFGSDGSPIAAPAWDARALLTSATVTPATRKIVTCCTVSGGGLPFTNTNLTTTPVITRTNYATFANVPNVASGSQSIANYIAYLRGDTTQEVANGGVYRNRKYRLGDIVNSKPVTVGAPGYQYFDTYNPGYAAFKTAYASRVAVVYAGANDGMLHAFDGTVGNATSGSELFAYIPSFVYGTTVTAPVSGLASLGNPTAFSHHYMVDATPGEFDVDFSKTSGATGAPDWHTVLIGGLGKGGKGYYAIDVTDPSSWTSGESAVASKVLWEFTDARLGYTYGVPSVVKTKKWGWVVVFTSGYGNSDGMGYVFFVNPKTGVLLETVSTPSGSGSTSSPLDMGQQTAYVENYVDGTADAIYAGDVQGNLWRVDVSAATGSYSNAVKIAQFGNSQPITTRPLIEVPPNTNTRYVMVGTGKLLADSDIQTSAQQSFYAIADGSSVSGQFYGSAGNPLPTTPTNVTFPITRSQLNANTTLTAGIGSNPSSAMGWYFDLPVTSGIAQRVNVDPFANQGVVAWIGNTPNGSACSPSGTGVVYAVSFASGQSVLLATDGVTLTSSQTLSGVGTEVVIVSVGGNLGIYTGTSNNTKAKAPANLTGSNGVIQINWRDVPTTN